MTRSHQEPLVAGTMRSVAEDMETSRRNVSAHEPSAGIRMRELRGRSRRARYGRLTGTLAAGVVALPCIFLGCNEPDTGGRPDDEVPDATTSATGGPTYPDGPFGVSAGQTIEDYAFDGFPSARSARDTLVPMRLGDFYNPDGDETFPDGSPFGAGQPKPRALAIVVGAVWCAPCQQEARAVLPEQNAILTPLGGQIFFVLADSEQPGVPASSEDLERWTKTFETEFPAALDRDYALGAVIKAEAYPANILIDTRTMAIVDVVSGVPPESYWEKVQTVARGD